MAESNTPLPSSAYEADERVAARQAETLAEEKWRTLCTQHASTFVASERRTESIQSALEELLHEIAKGTIPAAKNLGYTLDPNSTEADDDREAGDGLRPASELLADLAEKHRLRRRTLMQHSSLLELLELPSLMDACVRSSLYDDALSIAAFANSLERRHLKEGSTGGAVEKDGVEQKRQHARGDVIAGVVSEIRRRETDLRRQLIHRLRGDVSMPQCLEVVTALRRLNGVELERRGLAGPIPSISRPGKSDQDYWESVHAAMEMRLQLDFLEARDHWLEIGVTKVGSAQAAVAAANASSSNALEKGSSAQSEQILDGIERYRTRCFEIVTQFLAIFRGSFATSATSIELDHSHSLLSMWTSRRIQTFLTTLNSNVMVHVHDTATLRDALDAASFFASSMGRVGSDFQSLLFSIFERRLTEMVVGYWSSGLNGMQDTLKACRDAGVSAPLIGTETMTKNEYSDNDPADIQSSQTLHPPRKLLGLPALARFVNAYLTGLNELRRCLLPGAFPAIRLAHSKLIAEVKSSLQTNERSVLTPGLRGEASRLREVASRMKSEFDNYIASYLADCLEVAFGSLDYAMVQAERAAEEAKAAAKFAAEKEDTLRIEKERVEEEAEEAEQRTEGTMSDLPETEVGETSDVMHASGSATTESFVPTSSSAEVSDEEEASTSLAN